MPRLEAASISMTSIERPCWIATQLLHSPQGCGVGPLRRSLGAEEFRITGLELSAEAAEAARANYDACEVCDVESPWPIGPASLDGVHAGAIL